MYECVNKVSRAGADHPEPPGGGGAQGGKINQSINQSLFANAITSKQHKSVAGCQNRQ